MMLRLTVNGAARTLPRGSNLQQLVEELALGGRKIAVEINQQIVPRSEYATHPLQEGDVVEIVQAIGGG